MDGSTGCNSMIYRKFLPIKHCLTTATYCNDRYNILLLYVAMVY